MRERVGATGGSDRVGARIGRVVCIRGHWNQCERASGSDRRE